MKKLLPLFVLITSFNWLLAQVPQTLSYQGLLTDATGAPVANGSYNVTFNFYTVATGGTAQSRTVTGINTFQGLFTTIIGNGASNSANAPLNNLSPALGSTQYFIGLQVNNGTELSPRVALTAVPYAFAASSLDASATVAGSQLNSPITNAAVTIPATQITGTLSNAQYADNSITDAKIATGINATKITGNLPSTQVSGLGSLAAKSTVAAADIADGAVTDAKLAAGISVTKISGNLPSTQVSGLGSLATLSTVTSTQITDGTIGTIDITDGAITNAKVSAGIDAGKITAGVLPIAQIAAASIDNSKLASGIDAAKITTGTLTLTGTDATKLAAGTTAQRPAGVEGQVRYNSTEKVMEYFNGTNWYFLTPKIAYLKETYSTGSSAGTALNAVQYNKRTLNTLEGDGSFVTLNANSSFVLVPGEYTITANIPSYKTQINKSRLLNTSTNISIIAGSNEYYDASGNVAGRSHLMGRFTITTTTTFELQHYYNGNFNNADALGVQANSGESEVYSQVLIMKLR